MGEIRVKLKIDKATGQKTLLIDYNDEEMMRHEHEQTHRKIVEQLVGKGVLSDAEANGITVERVSHEEAYPEDSASDEAEPEAMENGC